MSVVAPSIGGFISLFGGYIVGFFNYLFGAIAASWTAGLTHPLTDWINATFSWL